MKKKLNTRLYMVILNARAAQLTLKIPQRRWQPPHRCHLFAENWALRARELRVIADLGRLRTQVQHRR